SVTPRSKDTLFKAQVRGDKALVVHVEKGSTEVMNTKLKKSVIVKENEASITFPDKAPSAPVKVPKMSEFDMPEFNAMGEWIPPKGYVKENEIEVPLGYKVAPLKEYKPAKEAP